LDSTAAHDFEFVRDYLMHKTNSTVMVGKSKNSGVGNNNNKNSDNNNSESSSDSNSSVIIELPNFY
jgi:hypothetical protein